MGKKVPTPLTARPQAAAEPVAAGRPLALLDARGVYGSDNREPIAADVARSPPGPRDFPHIVKRVTVYLKGLAFYFALCVATFLMARMALDYAAFNDNVDFLRFKQAYVGYWWWKVAFYVHVFSAIAALLAGFTQFSASFLRRHRRWHRILGRIYAYDVLAINFPTGMVLAVCANGLLPGRIAFVLLDCLWFAFTLIAIAAVRNGRIARHREFMIRSYALTLSAITLRTWKLILSHSFQVDAIHLYMIEAWMGFVPNLLVAEWWIRNPIRHRPASDGSAKTPAIFQI